MSKKVFVSQHEINKREKEEEAIIIKNALKKKKRWDQQNFYLALAKKYKKGLTRVKVEAEQVET